MIKVKVIKHPCNLTEKPLAVVKMPGVPRVGDLVSIKDSAGLLGYDLRRVVDVIWDATGLGREVQITVEKL